MSRIDEALARAERDTRMSEAVAPAPVAGEGPLHEPVLAAFPAEADPQGVPASAAVPTPPAEVATEAVPAALVETGDVPLHERISPAVLEKTVAGDMRADSLEQYRRVAGLLHHAQESRGLKVVMVASAVPGEGKTLTAANLALTLSESFQRRVLLVDADLRRPTLHSVLQLPNEAGLTDTLHPKSLGSVTAIRVTPLLTVLPAGPPTHDPMSALVSERMRALLGEASAQYDWVIIDTPPVALLPDANLLAAMVDGAILVVGANSTHYSLVERAVTAIGRDRVLGVVMNRVARDRIRGSGYYYDHYYARYGYRSDSGNGNGNGSGGWLRRFRR